MGLEQWTEKLADFPPQATLPLSSDIPPSLPFSVGLAQQLSRRLPFAVTARLPSLPVAAFEELGLSLALSAFDTDDGEIDQLWEGDNVAVRVFGIERLRITVWACSQRDALSWRARLLTVAAPAAGTLPTDDEVASGPAKVAFSYMTNSGSVRIRPRDVSAPSWATVAGNYATSTQEQLADLMTLSGPPQSGRLLLLHGEAGTGKSTALLALATAWRRWCDFVYVMDPEQMFASADYLFEVASGSSILSQYDTDDDDDDDDGPDLFAELEGMADEELFRPPVEREQRWRMLVIEDAFELIAADAQVRSGQALSRLLNVADGVIGAGLQTMLCVTTNEKVSALHSATVRPGRCMAEIEVPALSPSEAARWWAAHAPDGQRRERSWSEPVALAELYAQLSGAKRVSSRPPADSFRPGTYL
jgi:hypothetical protein